MTLWMDRVFRMSVSGFLVSTMRSAALPGAIASVREDAKAFGLDGWNYRP